MTAPLKFRVPHVFDVPRCLECLGLLKRTPSDAWLCVDCGRALRDVVVGNIRARVVVREAPAQPVKQLPQRRKGRAA